MSKQSQDERHMCQKCSAGLFAHFSMLQKHKLLSELIFWVLFLVVFHIPYILGTFLFLYFVPFFVLYSKSEH